MIKVNVTLSSDSSNVVCPVTGHRESLFTGDKRTATHLQKIDPSVPGWGNLKVSFECSTNKPIGSTSGVTSHSVSTSSDAYTTSYGNGGYSIITSYVPSGGGMGGSVSVGTGGDDIKVVCPADGCNEENDYG